MKAPVSTVTTPSAPVTLSSPVQRRKANSPICVTVAGIVTERSIFCSAKALASIEVTVSPAGLTSGITGRVRILSFSPVTEQVPLP